METGECVYSVISPGGNYECSESGLRWSCAGPVTLQYRFSKEELFWDQLQVLGYRPAGPLMDIRLLSGELEEVHLPHFLCLDGSDPAVLGDAVWALHGDDSGVSLETCELSRFHGRLPAWSFSLWQLVVSLGIPVKSHCEVLIYQSCPKPLILNTFLVPTPSTARQQVEERWRSQGALSILKPPPDHSLWLRSSFQLHTSCSSVITPPLMTLTYKTAPTFFQVCLKSPPEDFTMELRTAEENRPVWATVMWRGADYHRTRDQAEPCRTQTEPQGPAGVVDESREVIRSEHTGPIPKKIRRDASWQPSRAADSHIVSAPLRQHDPGQEFFSKHRLSLETRLPSVLASILISLQDRQVLNDQEREYVESKHTSRAQNYDLLSMIHRKGATAQQVFYEVIKEVDPTLVNDLERDAT